jgi:hypothetical protein
MSPRVNVLLAVFFLLIWAEASHRLAQMQSTQAWIPAAIFPIGL